MTNSMRNPHRTTQILLTSLAIFLACPFPGSAQSFETPAVLRAGDVIQIQVWRQPEFSGEFEITGTGTIAHPLYSEIKAAGREISDVEEELRLFLGHYMELPSFVVEVFFRVPVGGEVRMPNVYPLTPQTTVARAVSLAGGPTPRGRLDRVILRRNGQPYFVDLASPDVELRNPEIRSGDEIVVERRVDVFREYVAPSASIVAAIAAVLRLII